MARYDVKDVVTAALAKLKQDPPPNTTEQMLNPFNTSKTLGYSIVYQFNSRALVHLEERTEAATW